MTKKVFSKSAALILAVVMVFTLLPGMAMAADTITDFNVTVTYGQTEARAMLDYINKFRAGEDVDGQKADYINSDDATKTDLTGTLSPLTYDYNLEKVAMQRAAEIAMSFSHTRPNGTSCSTAWNGTGSWYSYGENIAAGTAMSSAYSAFKDWREDDHNFSGQGHRRNMLDSGFNRIGIGHVVFNGYHFWTQAFGYGSGSDVETTAVDSTEDVTVAVASSNIVSSSVTATPESYELTVGDISNVPEEAVSLQLTETWPARSFNTKASATWTSEDTSIAEIQGNTVSAISSGSTNISAVVNGTTVAVPVTVKEAGGSNEDIVDSGTCGEKLTWTLDSEGLLTISGTGDMDDWDLIDRSPWYSNGNIVKKVIVEDGVTSIGYLAFDDCYNLVDIEIANSVTRLGGLAFADCSSITSIKIPAGINTIENSEFYGCGSLEEIIVDSENAVFDSRDNCNAIIETQTNILVSGCKNSIIPKGVTSIGNYAFDGCKNLLTIEIPDSVKSIGRRAFCECVNLSNIIIPESITSIGDAAFMRCENLTNVILPNDITSIEDDMFSGCKKLISIIIPNGVTRIGNRAFIGCDNLKSIEIPDSISTIDDAAFWLVDSLTDIYYSGSESQWNKINIEYGNECLEGAVKHFGKSESTIDISNCVISPIKDQSYTGKNIKPAVTVKNGNTTLKAGTDYTVSYTNNKNVGTATVTITGKGDYSGTKTATFNIVKAVNPLKVKVSSKTYKRSNLTKKKSFNIGASKAEGNVTYTLNAKAKKAKITVSKEGKVTIPKKCKKGTYKITVKASGDNNYKAAAKNVTIKVK